LVVLFFVACTFVSLIPEREMWFGLLTNLQAQTALAVAGALILHKLSRRYLAAIVAYVPATPLQAKRANEQIKLMANFTNAIATAWIAIAVLNQVIRDNPPPAFSVMTAIALAGILHIGAREIVGQIKDETPQPILDQEGD
jgi:hypothetical protein